MASACFSSWLLRAHPWSLGSAGLWCSSISKVRAMLTNQGATDNNSQHPEARRQPGQGHLVSTQGSLQSKTLGELIPPADVVAHSCHPSTLERKIDRVTASLGYLVRPPFSKKPRAWVWFDGRVSA